MSRSTVMPDSTRIADLNARLAPQGAMRVLEAVCQDSAQFGRSALLSSFGSDSIVLLHMLAQIAPDHPVLFLDTGKLFAETLQYQQQVCDALGLTQVQHLQPEPILLSEYDPAGTLHRHDANACCHVRKVLPLEKGLRHVDSWISGRKRFQSASRAQLSVFEYDESGRLKVNPLAHWSWQDIKAYIDTHALPRHPLVARGYASIGCEVCTSPVQPGEDPRAGRWRDQDKQECGIHIVAGEVQRLGAQPS